MSMMPEFWWRIFLASLATVVLAKLLGVSYGVFTLFAMAVIGWTVVLLGLLQLDRLRERLWRKLRKSEDQNPPPA